MSATSEIEVSDLVFGYSPDRPALAGVSLTVTEGECVGIVGPNGAGKTTLFLCLMGVLSGFRGDVRVAGLDVRDSGQRKRLPALAGIVFQNSDDQLFNATVLDDVAFGPLNLGLPADEVRARVAAALARVGMSGQEQRTPFHLSGGEKRRVALAGVLAMRPRVLLLDEPSMFLDPRGRRELLGLLASLEGTKLVATHDLEMIVEVCGRVVVLDQGKIVADGAPRVILGDGALMEAHGLEVPHSLRR